MIKRKFNTYRYLIFFAFLLLVFIGLDLLLGRILISPSDRSFRIGHSYYHHGLIPNQLALASWYMLQYPMFTNSLGFRDSKVREIPLVTDKHRILFMGDSHTEGVGIRFEDTFTGQVIEQIDTSRIDILNAAAVSYSHKIYYLKTRYLIEETGLKIDELYVFIDISDIQNEIVYEPFEPKLPTRRAIVAGNTRHALINRSFTVHTLSKLRQKQNTRRFLKKTELFDEYRKDEQHVNALDLYASFFSSFDDRTLLSNPMFHGVAQWLYDEDFKELAYRGMKLGRVQLQKLHELCLRHGIDMTIVVHPWQEQIEIGNPEDAYVMFWQDFALSNNIGFINLYPVFIDPPVSSSFGITFFIPGDNHWNRHGHWLVAQEVMKHIAKTK